MAGERVNAEVGRGHHPPPPPPPPTARSWRPPPPPPPRSLPVRPPRSGQVSTRDARRTYPRAGRIRRSPLRVAAGSLSGGLALVLTLLLVSESGLLGSSEGEARGAPPTAPVATLSPGAPPCPDLPEVPPSDQDQGASRRQVTIVTTCGSLRVVLVEDRFLPPAFVELIRLGYYNGQPITQLVPGMFVRFGDPDGDPGVASDGPVFEAKSRVRWRSDLRFGDVALLPAGRNLSGQLVVVLKQQGAFDLGDARWALVGRVDAPSRAALGALSALPVGTDHRPLGSVVVSSVHLTP